MTDEQDRHFLAQAIALANKGLFTTDPNPRVGCVIVKDNSIIAQGWHQRAGLPHAEINALEQCGNQAQGATVYVSLEPCSHHGKTPPCADALISAQVKRVVVGCLDPNPLVAGQGMEKLRAAGITVKHGVLTDQAEALNPGFMKRMRTGMPLIRSKTAMSMDGRTAMASGESKWITSDQARADVQHWRARSSAIITGIETILADDPSLTARISNAEREEYSFTDDDYPVRIILDSQLRCPANAKTLTRPGKVILFTANEDQAAANALEDQGAQVCVVDRSGSQDSTRLDLENIIKHLAERHFNEILVEAGPTLNGALMEAGLIDELIFYIAPSIMGDQARPAFYLPSISEMSEKIQLAISDTRQIGPDWRIIAHLVK